jgi:hypothetical protein
LRENYKAWFYATGIMLIMSFLVIALRLTSIILFTFEFEVTLVYLPTIVLIAVSLYLMKVGVHSPT